MADKIYGDKQWLIKRFTCDCFDPGHSLTIGIEKSEGNKITFCEFSLYLVGRPSLWWRIKQAWQCLKGKDGNLGEFILREGDYPEMINLINQLGG